MLDSFEMNKVLGAVLGTCLGVVALNIAAGAVFAPGKLDKPGYEIEVGSLVGVYSDPRTQVIDYGERRVHAINLCFEAFAGDRQQLGTPDETLAWGFFAIDALPQPFVPIHAIRVSDAAQRCDETRVR